MKHNFIKVSVHSFCIVVLSILFCQYIPFDFSNMPNFGAVQDMDITDFYNAVANSRNVAQLDTNVVIVDIGQSTREQIAESIEIINECEPKAIGLDVTFVGNKDPQQDLRLVETIVSTPNLVVSTDFNGDLCSFFEDLLPSTQKGFANLGDEGTVIRQYFPSFPRGSDSIYSFAFQMLRVSGAGQKVAEKQNIGDDNYIIYPSKEFNTFTFDSIRERGDELTNKYVLIASISEKEDTHITPIDQRMNGVKIHAYILSSMLSTERITKANPWLQWIISIFVVFLLIYARVCFMLSSNSTGDILVRILQLFVVWAFVYSCYLLYIHYYIYCNFSMALYSCISLLVADIWQAGLYLYDKIVAVRRKS